MSDQQTPGMDIRFESPVLGGGTIDVSSIMEEWISARLKIIATEVNAGARECREINDYGARCRWHHVRALRTAWQEMGVWLDVLEERTRP